MYLSITIAAAGNQSQQPSNLMELMNQAGMRPWLPSFSTSEDPGLLFKCNMHLLAPM